MELDLEKLKAEPSEALHARKQEILVRQEQEREEVHAINGILHERNMRQMAIMKAAQFLKDNGVAVEKPT